MSGMKDASVKLTPTERDAKIKQLSSEGFEEKYHRQEVGVDFAQLVDAVNSVDPETRVRFTLPHPKDFPPHLVDLIAARHNVCNSIHLPSQSGSSSVLQRMRWGYSREAYLDLVSNIRTTKIPSIAISTDMISVFCDETDEDHQQTLDLMRTVGYENAFCFAFSTREKTHAARKLADDVPAATKKSRLNEVLAAFRGGRDSKNLTEIGALHCVLVEGTSTKSEDAWQGCTDTNKTAVFSDGSDEGVECGPGDYVIVQVEGLHASTLQAWPVEKISLAGAEARIAQLQQQAA